MYTQARGLNRVTLLAFGPAESSLRSGRSGRMPAPGSGQRPGVENVGDRNAHPGVRPPTAAPVRASIASGRAVAMIDRAWRAERSVCTSDSDAAGIRSALRRPGRRSDYDGCPSGARDAIRRCPTDRVTKTMPMRVLSGPRRGVAPAKRPQCSGDGPIVQ